MCASRMPSARPTGTPGPAPSRRSSIAPAGRTISRRGVDGDRDVPFGPVRRARPVRHDQPANGPVRRSHPVEPADHLRPDDDAVEARRVGGGLNAAQPVEEPLADRAEHRVVVRIGVVAEGPVLPQRRRAAGQHVAPAGERLLRDHVEHGLRVAFARQRIQREVRPEDACGEVAAARVADVVEQPLDGGRALAGRHQPRVQRVGGRALGARVRRRGLGLPAVVRECRRHRVGQHGVAGRVVAAAEDRRQACHQPCAFDVQRRDEKLRRRFGQRLVIAEPVLDDVARVGGGHQVQPSARCLVLPLDEAPITVVRVELRLQDRVNHGPAHAAVPGSRQTARCR